jgi:hypothetical protein
MTPPLSFAPRFSEGLSDGKAAQLFEAIKALTPPTRGGIERVEIGGGLTDGLARIIQSAPNRETSVDV